jgi:hypothetical protein
MAYLNSLGVPHFKYKFSLFDSSIVLSLLLLPRYTKNTERCKQHKSSTKYSTNMNFRGGPHFKTQSLPRLLPSTTGIIALSALLSANAYFPTF